MHKNMHKFVQSIGEVKNLNDRILHTEALCRKLGSFKRVLDQVKAMKERLVQYGIPVGDTEGASSSAPGVGQVRTIDQISTDAADAQAPEDAVSPDVDSVPDIMDCIYGQVRDERGMFTKKPRTGHLFNRTHSMRTRSGAATASQAGAAKLGRPPNPFRDDGDGDSVEEVDATVAEQRSEYELAANEIRARMNAIDRKYTDALWDIAALTKRIDVLELSPDSTDAVLPRKITVEDVRALLYNMEDEYLKSRMMSPLMASRITPEECDRGAPPLPPSENNPDIPSQGIASNSNAVSGDNTGDAVMVTGEDTPNATESATVTIADPTVRRMMESLQYDIEWNRKELRSLSWRVRSLDDQQNRFALLRQFIGTTLRQRIMAGPINRRKHVSHKHSFEGYTLKTPGAPCTYETALILFRAIREMNSTRCRFEPDDEVLHSSGVNYGRRLTAYFPTFADVCAILHIDKSERAELINRSSMSGKSGGAGGITTLIGTELKYNEGEEDDDFSPFRLKVEHVPAEDPCFALLEPSATFGFILRWMRTYPGCMSKKHTQNSVIGNLQLEFPMLHMRQCQATNDIAHAIRSDPELLASLVDSPFENAMPAPRLP